MARVFLTCRWILLLSFSGAYWQGISAQEIDAACRLRCVKRADWSEVLEGVRIMESAAQPILNEKK